MSEEEIHRLAIEHALRGYAMREVHVRMLLERCERDVQSMLATGGQDAYARELQSLVEAVRAIEVMR